MVLKFLSTQFGVEYSSIPNKFTIGMGELIRKAREEAGMSQSELAERAHFRQASISEIENGKREVTSSELLYFSNVLEKPITYFFPRPFSKALETSDLTPLEQELLLLARKMNEKELKKIIAQIRAIVDFNE